MGSMAQLVKTGWLCRLCTGSSKVVIHIFGQMGRKIDLQRLINEYTPFKIFLYDDLPKTICITCLKGVMESYKFYQKIEKLIKEQAEKKKNKE